MKLLTIIILSIFGLWVVSAQDAEAQSRNLYEQFPELRDSLRRNPPQQQNNVPTKPQIKTYPWSNDPLIQKFLRDYFKNKPVYLVQKRLQELINYGYVDREPTDLSYLIGFLAELFLQNEDKVLGWLNGLEISQYQAGAFIRAMRHAGQQDLVKAWLATKPKWVYRNNPSFHNLIVIDSLIADEIEDFEILTGAYAASGKEIYVQRFAEAFTIFPKFSESEIGQDPEKAKKTVINRGLQEILLLIMFAYPQSIDQLKNVIPKQPERAQNELKNLLVRLETFQGPSSEFQFQSLPQNFGQ